MRVTKIDLVQTNSGLGVLVEVEGAYSRIFTANAFQPDDVARFLADCEDARQRTFDCRAIFMAGGNLIPFPGGEGKGKSH